MCQTSVICTDLLPARPGSCRGAGLNWDAAARVLELVTDRKSDRRYAVAELTVDREFCGRGFSLAKLSAGTDREADGYTVFVADAGPGRDSCECRGFLRHGHCSHLDGVRTVIANGWMDRPAERPVPAEPTLEELEERAEAEYRRWLAAKQAEWAEQDRRAAEPYVCGSRFAGIEVPF